MELHQVTFIQIAYIIDTIILHLPYEQTNKATEKNWTVLQIQWANSPKIIYTMNYEITSDETFIIFEFNVHTSIICSATSPLA